MKILQVNCVYKEGSTGKIVDDIHNIITKNGLESIVCYGNGTKINNKGIYKFSNVFLQKFNALYSRITGFMYGGCYIATKKLERIIQKEKPDVVHLHCINGHIVNIYKFTTWLNKNNIKTLLTLHAEFMYTANCGYALECNKWLTGCGNCPRLKKETKSLLFDSTHLSWERMYSAFQGFNNLKIVSVSPWLMARAKTSPIFKDFDHTVVLNGLDTSVFHKYDTKELRKELGLEGKKIIFHTTAFFNNDINHIKGGYYLLKLADKLKDENVQILVAGSYDENVSVPSNITLLGKVTDQNLLAKYYSMADLFVLTSRKETFSMPVAESLCTGTPVVGFKAGAPEQITIKEYSCFVENGNIDELYKEVKKFLSIEKDTKLEKIAKEKYSKEKMANEYIKLYNIIKNGD